MRHFLIALPAFAALLLHFVFVCLADFLYAPGVTCYDPCTFHWHPWGVLMLFLPEVLAAVGLVGLVALPLLFNFQQPRRVLTACLTGLMSAVVVSAIASGVAALAHPHLFDALART